MLAILTGCSSSRKVLDKSSFTASKLFLLLSQRAEKIKTFYAEGTISIDNPEFSNSGSFRLWLKMPDSLKVDIRGPLGIRVATIQLTENQEIYYDWMENKAFFNKGDELSFINPIPIEFNQLISTLIFGIPSVDFNSPESFTMSSDSYLLNYNSLGNKKNIAIDRITLLGTSYRWYGKDTIPEIIIQSSENIEVDGINFPGHINISDRKINNISIEYDEIKLNKPVICVFTIPQSAKVIGQ
jgi:hypothetical protein